MRNQSDPFFKGQAHLVLNLEFNKINIVRNRPIADLRRTSNS